MILNILFSIMIIKIYHNSLIIQKAAYGSSFFMIFDDNNFLMISAGSTCLEIMRLERDCGQ